MQGTATAWYTADMNDSYSALTCHTIGFHELSSRMRCKPHSNTTLPFNTAIKFFNPAGYQKRSS